jgi:hypothetical protein
MSKTGKSQEASEEQSVATDFFGLSGTSFGNEKQETLETVRSGSEAENVTEETTVNEVEVEITPEPEVKETVSVKKAESETPRETKQKSGDVLSVVQSLIDDDVLSFDENKEYAEDPTILKELILETKSKAFESGKQSFKEEYPEAAELLAVLAKGGSIQDYLEMSETLDFAKIPLDHVDNQRNLIEDWLTTQGYDEDEIADSLDAYEKSGKLKTQAEIAQRKLINWQKNETETKLQAIESSKVEAQKAADNDRNEFEKRILGLKKIKGFDISEKKAEELRDYLMKPVGKKGETKFKQDDTEENRLLYAYMSMTKFDKEALAREEGTKVTLKLKKNINNFQDPNMSPKRGASDVIRGGQSASTNIPWAWGATS